MKLRQGTDIDTIAMLHEKLATAANLLNEAVMLTSAKGGSAVTAASSDKLCRIAESIRMEIYSLESVFMRIGGNDTPFVDINNPSSWREWIKQRWPGRNP